MRLLSAIKNDEKNVEKKEKKRMVNRKICLTNSLYLFYFFYLLSLERLL